MPDTPTINGNGTTWNSWSRYVREALTDGKRERAEIQKSLAKLHLEFAEFRATMLVKAGIWGLIAGIIPVVGYLLLHYLRTP